MAVRTNIVWLLAIALVSMCGAMAKKACNCHIGVRYSNDKIIYYGKVDSFSSLSSGKKRKCSESCARKCGPDIQNGQLLCERIGTDYDNSRRQIGCFSVVGKRDNRNNTWDFDGIATFARCERRCECPQGSYDNTRQSCVESTGNTIPGLPNGDIGNGFWVLNSTVFKDIPGATCSVKAVY